MLIPIPRFAIIAAIALAITAFATINIYTNYGLSAYFPVNLKKQEANNLAVTFKYANESKHNAGPSEYVPTFDLNHAKVRITCLGVEPLCDPFNKFPNFFIEHIS